LLTAYLLRRHQPVVLEQAPRSAATPGSWRGMDYAIGAACHTAPEAGSPWRRCMPARRRFWRRKPEGHWSLDGRLVEDFWRADGAPHSVSSSTISAALARAKAV
jgi:hypothetical protein